MHIKHPCSVLKIVYHIIYLVLLEPNQTHTLGIQFGEVNILNGINTSSEASMHNAG